MNEQCKCTSQLQRHSHLDKIQVCQCTLHHGLTDHCVGCLEHRRGNSLSYAGKQGGAEQSHADMPEKKPLTLNLHSTTFISQEGRCCSTADAKPVQLHPPGRETVDGHFISFRPIEPSTARFLTNGRSRVDLSTGQWVLTRCHCVMQSLQNEWPSWQVMGCLKTPWLNNEYIKAHASKC